jgi:hypothetical protein
MTPGRSTWSSDRCPCCGPGRRLSSKIVKDATLKIYSGAPHGLAQTTAYKDEFNTDLLNFLKS